MALTTAVVKDPIDKRDHLYQAVGKIVNLPESVDLRVFDRDGIQDQGRSNSCVANATCSAIEILLSRASRFQDMSRLFHYWNVREISGKQGSDNGATARDAMRVVNQFGICPESSWPFDLSRVNEKPPQRCYDEAKSLAGGEYCQIAGEAGSAQRLQNMQCALAEGFPIFFAADIGDSWHQVSGKTLEETADFISANCIRRPASTSSHAMLFVGYKMYKGNLHLIIENSWGGWGCGGYALVPYDWWVPYSYDYWIMHSIPGITLPTIWTPQLEGQKPKPIKPVRPKEREVAPNGKKHSMVCTIKRWVDRCFGREPKCRCGALR